MNNEVRIRFDKFYGETHRSYLVSIFDSEVWLPKKMVRQFTTNKKLGGWCIIPVWLYRERFGCEPDDSEYETIITHHIPEYKEKLVSNKIDELKIN